MSFVGVSFNKNSDSGITSWIRTPCELLLTNAISLRIAALFLVAARVRCLDEIGAATATLSERKRTYKRRGSYF